MKNLTNNQTLELNIQRNPEGEIVTMQLVLNRVRFLTLNNNSANMLGKVYARKGFHAVKIPILLKDKKVSCTANVPTLISIMRKWLIENIIEASTLAKHVVSVECIGDASIEDIERMVVKESRTIRQHVCFVPKESKINNIPEGVLL